MKNVIVKKINATETYTIRNMVLRIGKPIETCVFMGDTDPNTAHFGLFYETQLIGVASVFKISNKLFNQKNQYQLRGMAILKSYQGMGLGGLLVKKVFEYCNDNNVEIIWCNARNNAVSFYKKLGFSVVGNAFEISDIGVHYLMKNVF